MVSGWQAAHSSQYANLEAMVQSGNLHMTKAYSIGSMVMEEKVQLYGKSGYLFVLLLKRTVILLMHPGIVVINNQYIYGITITTLVILQ